MFRFSGDVRHRSGLWRPHGLCSAAVACGMVLTAGAQTATGEREASVAIPSGTLATTFEQLRVTAIADGLIAYLDRAVRWVDQPESNMPVASISEKIRSAVMAHPEVRLAGEQRATAALATREAYGGFLPKVTANLESGKRQNDPVNTPWNVAPAFQDNSKAFAVTANQLVYDFGALGHQVDARTAQERVALSRADLKTSELALRATSAWLEMFRARQLVDLSAMNVSSRQQLLTFIEEREQLGASAKSDVLRARARLADAQVSASEAQTQIAAAEATYREIFNEAAPRMVQLPRVPDMPLQRYANFDYLFGRSPQLAQAAAQTEAARLEAKSAAAALRPAVYFDFTARRRDLGGEGTAGTDWTAGFVVRQTLYSGGSDLARKQQADQRAIEAQLAEDNVKRQLERLYVQAVADVQTRVAAVTARKEAAKVAAVALEAVREQFAFRRGSLLDLLRAQEELFVAGRQLIDGVVDESLARYRLLHLAMELNPLFEIAAQLPLIPVQMPFMSATR